MAHDELLARTEFFGDAPADLVRDLAAKGSELHLIRGDVIFREGDIADALYLVVSGRIAIAIANPIDHRETVVALMDAGDLFGEMAMLDDGPRSALARALEPSTVLAIPFDPVVGAFRSDPGLLWGPPSRPLGTRRGGRRSGPLCRLFTESERCSDHQILAKRYSGAMSPETELFAS